MQGEYQADIRPVKSVSDDRRRMLRLRKIFIISVPRGTVTIIAESVLDLREQYTVSQKIKPVPTENAAGAR